MADLRKEATLQGVTSVKVWGCNQACYSNLVLEQGGADVDGTQIVLTTLPFYSEYKLNPTLKKLVAAVGGIDKVDYNAVSSVGRRTALPGRGDEGDRQRRHAQPPVAVRRAEAGEQVRRQRDHRSRRHRQPRSAHLHRDDGDQERQVRPHLPEEGRAPSTAARRTWSYRSWISSSDFQLRVSPGSGPISRAGPRTR